MGEYADDYFRQEVKAKFGFDPGSMYGEDRPVKSPRVRKCPKCNKAFRTQFAVKDHLRDKHGVPPKDGLLQPSLKESSHVQVPCPPPDPD